MERNFQQMLLEEISLLLEPLVTAANSELRRRQLFLELGWDLEAIPGLPVAELRTILSQFVAAHDDLLVWLENPPNKLAEVRQAFTTVEQTITAARRIATLMDSPGLTRPPQFDQLGRDLVSYLTTYYFQWYHPTVYALAVLLTLIRPAEDAPLTGYVVDSGSKAILRVPYPRPELQYERIGQLLSNPVALLKQEYLGPTKLATVADAQQMAKKLFPRLCTFFATLGISSIYGVKPEYGLDFGAAGNLIASQSMAILARLDIASAAQGANAGMILTLSSADRGNLGLMVVPFGTLTYADVYGTWAVDFGFTAAVESFAVGPEGFILRAASGITSISGRLRVDKLAEDGSQAFLVGSTTGTRLEIGQFAITGETRLDANQQDYGFLIEVGSAAFVVVAGDGDGFLQKVLPKDGFRTDFDLGIGWSNRKGLYFRGSAGLEATLPVHKDLLGVLKVDSIYLALQVKDVNNEALIETVAAATASVKLGPFTANVERMGLSAKLTFPPKGDNLGSANIELGFKPPDGAGMAIDATAIVGGGYLFYDLANEQYAGVLQLEVKGGISLKAIGLLTTRLPGLPPGTKGFSLLVIISAEFPPIQLGFGFALTGVGGLLGVNRTMVLEVLRSGIKNRTLDSVLFPENPVQNAPKIISDLQSVFPPVTGQFVLGPMAKLAWGKPATILTIELGIVIELPSPVRLAIMGQLWMALPSQEVPEILQVVVLRMDVLGAIDFDKSDASIDATLYDSRVAQFAISGDMAMRLNWGASPTFALSVGGFNPRFQPPPGFPTLDRLAISLATGDNPRLRLESYLALTSNTVQLGARLDVYVEIKVEVLGRFSAAAYLGFDALVHFPPFSFVVDIDGEAAIQHNGNSILSVRVHLALSGPEPWHACGEATFEFLGKRQIAIDITIGVEAPPAPLPPGDPLGELRKALADRRNWSAQLPSDGHMLVTLRQIAVAEESNEVLMHPFGELTVRQKVVPLDMTISKFGSTTPNNPGPFTISHVLFDSQSAFDGQSTQATHQIVRDPFAPGQFFEMSDDEQLTRPAFESLPSGCTRIGTAAISHSKVTVPASFQYDTVVIDNKEELLSRRGKGFEYEMAQTVLVAVAELGAAGQSAMRSTGSAKFAGDSKQQVTLKDPEYVVAKTDDMTWDTTSKKPTYTEAEAARRQKGAASCKYQVVGSHEVV